MNPLRPDRDADGGSMLADLLARLPGYTPEWAPLPGTAGRALLQVLARCREILDAGSARVPDRAFLAGLDMLGLQLLPAGAARVPLVFELAPDAPADVTLPKDSQVAAPAAPVVPSALDPTAPAPDAKPVVFATERTVTLARSRLSCLYSIVPGSDRYADHSHRLVPGFTLFDTLQPVEHAIYLGHDVLFALGGEITLIVGVSLDRGAAAPIAMRWEYLAEAGWIPLKNPKEHDTTGGFTDSGQLALRLECGPDGKQETVAGRKSHWVRGVVLTPVVQGMDALPLVINDLNVRVQFSKQGLRPDAAYYGPQVLDTSKAFLPFGPQPARRDSFYLASAEVFQRRGARCHVDLSMAASVRAGATTPAPPPTGGAAAAKPVLAFEYSTDTGWAPLGIEPAAFDFAPAAAASKAGIAFVCPADWAEAEVSGAKNRWLRITIVRGDYGRPGGMVPDPVRWDPGTLDPPVVEAMSLRFEYLTDPQLLDHCLSANDFVFADHSEDCRWPDRSFSPFRAVADAAPAIHLGFDRPLPVGLLSLYVDVGDAPGAANAASPYVWEYRRPDGWAELGVLDETAGFRRSGMLQFIGPRDATAVDGLGGALYRLRARLKPGEALVASPVAGVWCNAVWARHEARVVNETLGSSDGTPGQVFQFARPPVLDGETVEVREWSGRGESWRSALAGVSQADLRFERDPATGAATAAWVRWHPQAQMHDSGERDRHYEIERATGLLRLGRGTPAAGKRVVASYASGGGVAGNVAAGQASELRVAAPYVARVGNPVPAQGGAASESLDRLRARSPQRLRHRGRALAASDYEWLACEASPEVARCRCEPLLGAAGVAQRGAVSLRIVPWTQDGHPRPSAQLLLRVRDHVAAHAPAAVRLYVLGPDYVDVGVACSFAPIELPEAARVEARLRLALDRFLHPLTGGPTGRGWAFGETLYLSQIAALVEAVPGVDFARRIAFKCDGALLGEHVELPAGRLVAAGRHELDVMAGER